MTRTKTKSLRAGQGSLAKVSIHLRKFGKGDGDVPGVGSAVSFAPAMHAPLRLCFRNDVGHYQTCMQ